MRQNIDIEVMKAMIDNFKMYAIIFNTEEKFKDWIRNNFNYLQDNYCLYSEAQKCISFRKTKLYIICGRNEESIRSQLTGRGRFDKIFWRTEILEVHKEMIEAKTLRLTDGI